MKGRLPKETQYLLKQCTLELLSRKDIFWAEVIKCLDARFRSKDCPRFLSTQLKEVLNALKEEKLLKIVQVMPQNGSWGIYITDKDNYLFSCHNNTNTVYLSERLIAYLKNKNHPCLLAGILLHEVSELIMLQKAAKKNKRLELNKVHGEASRIERTFFNKQNDLDNLLQYLIGLEKDRNIVTIADNKSFFIDTVAVTGEEIIAEVSSLIARNDSFMVSLAPGEKKKIVHQDKTMKVAAKDYNVPFKLKRVNFNDYLKFLEILDNLFVAENIINPSSKYCELLSCIRSLDFNEENDNCLIGLLCFFANRFWKDALAEREFIFNLFLLLDEFKTYYISLKIISMNYWQKGKFAGEHLREIVNQIFSAKEVVLDGEKNNKEKIEKWLFDWFVVMKDLPLFADANDVHYRKIVQSKESCPCKQEESDCSEGDIRRELEIHKEILGIERQIKELMYEFRPYCGIRSCAAAGIYELLLLRTHFWRGDSLFSKGEQICIYNKKEEGIGLAEVLEIAEDSLTISMMDRNTAPPDNGLVRNLTLQDESLNVQLEVMKHINRVVQVMERIMSPQVLLEEKDNAIDFDLFNAVVKNNVSQMRAISEACKKTFLTLIQGPPGTGKTTVIAEIVLQYLRRGKRVLLTSQTHNAVDNALESIMRYKNHGFGVGRVASREEKIVTGCIKKIWIKDKKALDRLETVNKQGLVIGATNVGTHTLNSMKEREFDVLVMDEAGKSNIIELLLPVLLLKQSGKLIVVGDHKQGRPFEYEDSIVGLYVRKRGVKTRKRINALKDILHQSLFERLVKGGCHKVMLQTNYRSDSQIVNLISNLFYDGKLEPAQAISRKAKSIIVLDTSKTADIAKRQEILVGRRSYKNHYEAGLVLKEVKGIMKHHYLATGRKSRFLRGVTILAPYVEQVREITSVLSSGLGGVLSQQGIDELKDNIMTIDSFQGRENEIVVISLVRSNNDPAKIGFLNEFNRLNVALSRAKKKMIIIGDFATLRNARCGYRRAETRKIFEAIYKYG